MRVLATSTKMQMWTERLRRFEAAETTVGEFCRREKVSVPSFYYWRRKLSADVGTSTRRSRGTAESTAMVQRVQPVAFAEVQLQHSASPARAFLPNGVEINLGEQPDIVAVIVDRLINHSGLESNAGTTKSDSGATQC